MTLDVAIVGGGIAGLTAAYELSKLQVSCLVLERGARTGGVILSEAIDGFVVDGGPDSLLIQKPEGIKLCEELGIGDRLVPTKLPRFAYIQRGGRLHALPGGSVLGIPTRIAPFVKTRLFSWRGKLRMGAELLMPPKPHGADESIGSFMTRHFGREATVYLAEPLLAGIHAGDVDRLSMAALFPRFLEEEKKHGSLLRAFRSQARVRSSPDGAFKSLPGGLSELVDALMAALPDRSVRLNAPVSGISGAGPFDIALSGSAPVSARSVIFASPAFVTGDLLRDRDPELARRCSEIPYASAVTVALGFRREDVGHPLNGSGYVIPRVESSSIMAASWLSSKWPHRAPDNRVLMRAFLGGTRDPSAIERTDAELIAQSLDALRPVLRIRGEPILTKIYRWPRANAQHEVGHLARVAAIDMALTRHPGLFVTGSGFRGVGIPDCVADGRKTAQQVADYVRRLKS